jgi:putative polyhydroxyalkanoate system protein
MSVTVAHSLSTEEAKARVNGLVPGLKKEFAGMLTDFEESWAGDALKFSFKARGMNINGTATVEPSQVRVDYSLPLLARAFKGQFDAQIRDRLSKLLA